MVGRQFFVRLHPDLSRVLENLAHEECRETKDQLVWCARQYLIDNGLYKLDPLHEEREDGEE